MTFEFLTDDADRSEYDRHMDDLVLRIAKHMEGERAHDVACAAAVVSAISLKFSYKDHIVREEMFNKILVIMSEIIDSDDDLAFNNLDS